MTTIGTSSAPLEPGKNLPDSSKSVTKTDQVVAVLTEFFGEDVMRIDPTSQQMISADTYRRHRETREFGKMVTRTYNALERLDSWHTFFAKFRQGMEHTQTVAVNIFPKRPLIRTPEEVPPDMWQHKTEQTSFQMDRYSAAFEILGDFWAYGASTAAMIVSEKSANIISGTAISLKMKVSATLQRMKVPEQIKNSLVEPTYRDLQEATVRERTSYGCLTRTNKGIYTCIRNANKLASESQFQFNGMVVPFGTLDSIVANNFHSEAFRVGDNNAIQFLALGAKKLMDVLNGIQIFEDAKWNLEGVQQDEIEAFLHYSMHGGWIYNKGNEPCEPDDDPSYKYGFRYIHAGRRNWAEKLLFTLYKENNHFDQEGELHQHHWELAEKCDEYAKQAKITIYDGLLDPYLYRLPGAVNDPNMKVKYGVARTMGEVDLRYSPYEKIPAHVEKLRYIIGQRMSEEELAHVTHLEGISKELLDVDVLTSSMKAWVAGIAMATENARPTNTSPFLNVSNLNSAPMPLYVENIELIKDIKSRPVTGYLAGGASKVMYFKDSSNKKNYICVVRLDTKVPDSSRGEVNEDYMYVAIPEDSVIFDAAALDASSGTWDEDGGDLPFKFDKVKAASPSASTDNAWKLWNTAQIAANSGADLLKQGFKAPQLVQAPSKPFFYGMINGLRVLAHMYKNNDERGQPSEFLKRVYQGVVSLDKYMNILYDIYTEKNKYFSPLLVPLHMKTIDPVINRLNTAISGLWGDYCRPFMVRAPHVGHFVNGYQYVPNGSPDFLAARSISLEEGLQGIEDVLVDGLGLAIFKNAALGGPSNEKRILEAISLILDTGMLGGKARTVFTSVRDIKKFAESYQSGRVGRSYHENVLKRKDPVAFGTNNPDFWKFSTFFREELAHDLLEAGNENAKATGDVNKITSLLLRVAFKLKALIGTFVDLPEGEILDFELTKQWLDTMNNRASGQKSNYSIESSKTKETVEQFTKKIADLKKKASGPRSYTDGRLDKVAVGSSLGESISSIWVNSRLSVSQKLWNAIRSNLNNDLEIHRNHQTLAVLKNLSIPIRPVNPSDPGVALAGQLIPEADYNDKLATGAAPVKAGIVGSVSVVRQQMEYASAHGLRATEIFRNQQKETQRESFSSTGNMRGHVRDVEARAQRLTNSILERTNNRAVPEEFVNDEPTLNDTVGRQSYLTPIITTEGNGSEQVAYVEPVWIKARMEHIHRVYENDTCGRIYASLYCFSPNHLKVIERFLSNKIAPYGVGHIQARPFIKDMTGAVLFGVGGDSNIAECGMAAPISHVTLDGPHNRWYVYWSVWLGCAVYQPDKFMWVLSQVLRRNISGLTGDMYNNDQAFTIQNATRPTKSGWMIAVGDNLKFEQIPEPFAITSQFSIERYGKMLNNRSIISKGEQHIVGLMYVISMYRLWNMTRGVWSTRQSFYDEKYANNINTLCFSEDYQLWDTRAKKFQNPVNGQWHFHPLRPEDMDILEGNQVPREVKITDFRG